MDYKSKIKSKGLKITWLAKQLKVSQPKLSLFLQDKRSLTQKELKKLDELLN